MLPETTAEDRTSGVPGDPVIIAVRSAHRFDEKKLENYLVAHIPGLSPPMAVSQFQGGQSNPTYLIQISGRTFVMRKRPPGQLLASAHAVDREYRVMKSLGGTSVPVPKVYLLCEDEEIIGRGFFVMEYVEGRVFGVEALPGLSPGERSAIYEASVQTLAALHNIDYQSVGLDGFGRPEGYIRRQIGRWSRQYADSRMENCEAMELLEAWLVANVPDHEETSIVHGDFRLGNLLIHRTEPKVVGVLDWELATIGHPLADLAYLCQPYRKWQASGKPRPEGVPSEKEFLEIYCRHTSRESIQHWEFFLAFSFFRSSAIAAGVYRRGLEGNAADASALAVGRLFSQYAVLGWRIAQSDL